MTFTDDLALILDLLILVAVAVFYTGFLVWLSMRRHDRARALTQLQGGALLLGGLGVILGLFALWGEFTWPLSLIIGGNNVLAAYDILFFDSLTMIAFILIAFGLAVRYHFPTHFVGVLAAISGAGILYYGYRAYTLSLTLEPLETFLMFIAFGALGILSYPATLYLDWFVVGPEYKNVDPVPSDPTPRYPWMWTALLGLFMLVVVLAGVAVLLYGFNTAWAHLGSPP